MAKGRWRKIPIGNLRGVDSKVIVQFSSMFVRSSQLGFYHWYKRYKCAFLLMLLVSNTSGSDSRAASLPNLLPLSASHHFTDYWLCVSTKGIIWATTFNIIACIHMQCTHLYTPDVFGHDHCSRIRQNLCPTTSGWAISAMSNQSVTQTSTSFS